MAILQYTPRVARKITIEDVGETTPDVCIAENLPNYPVWLAGSLDIEPPLSRDDDYRVLSINLETRFTPYDTECSWMTCSPSKLIPNPDGPSTDFVAWLRYLIDTIFEPAGYSLNGNVKWIDTGYYHYLSVSNSEITVI